MRFVDSLGKPAIGGWIYGRVGLFQPSFSVDSDEESRPVDGATVFLDGADMPRRTTTVNGRFEFVGLPNGRYEVSVQMPQGLPPAKSLRLPEGTTEDPHDHDCTRARVRLPSKRSEPKDASLIVGAHLHAAFRDGPDPRAVRAAQVDNEVGPNHG
jgi:Carboxypeptidase regulatory-like domain